MNSSAPVTGTSMTSFADAAQAAFNEMPGHQGKEGLASAEVTRLWLSKGGVVGSTQFHVELTSLEADTKG